MVEVSDDLLGLFSGTVEETNGRYVVSVPTSAVSPGDVSPGETYRIALLNSSTEDASPEQPASQPSETVPEEDDEEGHPPPPVEEGETRQVRIESLGDKGDGIARVDRGYVIIVPDAEPGDTPEIEVERVRRNLAFARNLDAS